MITSTANPRVKNIGKLKHRKYRDLFGLTVIDGLREVRRAHQSGAQIEEVIVCFDLLEAFGGQEACDEVRSWGRELTEVSRLVCEKMCFGDRAEGILAKCRIPQFSLSPEGLGASPLIVVLDGIEKPGNLGAILRSCDGAGVDAVILTDPRTDVYNPNVIRSSTGTVFCAKVMQASASQAYAFLKRLNARIIAASPDGKQSYFTTDLTGAVALVLGSEDLGLSDLWMQQADEKVSIPMRGKADSLNVSTTAAILVYEALRQRR